MTVSYQYEVASSTSGGFTRLLFMWRGSLYKLIYRELLLFLILFGVLSALYRHAFTAAQKKEFEQIVVYCDTLITLIPLSFVLGFYVSYVAQRWWNQYQAIPWPDKVMHLVALYVAGNDEYGRMLRRALMRYLNLSLILVLRSISSAVKRRFPTLDHVVDSGFMTSLELDLFKSVPNLEFNTYWIPCTWFINLLKEARRSHRLPDAQGLKLIMEEFNDFRSKCGMLWSYDWVSIPLVYTQVVTLATYTFFGVALIGRQYIEGTQKQFQLKIDTYLPVFTILQFFFFMGLLKVAEQLINPFGDDDEDFELNWLIDRHTKVSYLGVDTLMSRCPPLVKDIYFDSENLTLPYTEAAAAYKKKTYRGSVADMAVPEEKQTMFLPDIAEEEEEIKESQTPRTSTFSLTVSDSPMNSRRQISGSPQVRPKMAHSSPEAVLQVDARQDSPIGESVPPEQKRHLVEAVKRFSALTRTPRIDPNRKPFFPLSIKTPKVTLQPWPSATNLSQTSSQEPGTPMPRASGMNFPPPCRSSLKVLGHSPPVISMSPPKDSLYDENLDEYDNRSNLSYEGYEDTSEICGCNDENNESPHSDICNFRCCHMVFNPEGEIDASMLMVEPGRPNVQVNPKYLVRRQSSLDGSDKRRGVHWSPSFSGQSSVVRNKGEGVKSIEENIPCAMSSPNLSNLEADLEFKRKHSFDVKLDPSAESKEVTKL